MTTLVSLDEIAVVLGKRTTATDVEVEAIQLGLLVQPDWKGTPSLSAAEATSLINGTARQTREHEKRWAAHVKRDQEWRDRQIRAGKLASEKVLADHRAKGRILDGEAWAEQNAAAQEAYAEFEQSTPKPEWSAA